jgi:hypothetical protein
MLAVRSALDYLAAFRLLDQVPPGADHFAL